MSKKIKIGENPNYKDFIDIFLHYNIKLYGTTKRLLKILCCSLYNRNEFHKTTQPKIHYPEYFHGHNVIKVASFNFCIRPTQHQLEKQANNIDISNEINQQVIDVLSDPAINHTKKYMLLAYMYIFMTESRQNENKIIYEYKKNKNKKLTSDCRCLYEFLTTKTNDIVSNETRIYTNFAKKYTNIISDCYNSHKLTRNYIFYKNINIKSTQLSEKSAAAFFVNYIHNFPLDMWTCYDTKVVKRLIRQLGYSLNPNIKIKDVIKIFKDKKRTNKSLFENKNRWFKEVFFCAELTDYYYAFTEYGVYKIKKD